MAFPLSDASDELKAIARLAAIVESSADAMVTKTLDGVITSWNSGAERMYGYAADEIIGRNISLLIPSERCDELPAILRRVANGERVEHFETERVRKTGAVFDATVSVSPVRDRAGMIVGASTVTRDMTDRKRAEENLRDLQEQLHQAQRLESVGRLAGGIAHDFNNLLAGIMNYSALVSDGLAELTARLGLERDEAVATLRQDAAEIGTVATRAARLTHQLLIFSRSKVVRLDVLDLNAVVVDMQQLLRRTLGESIDLRTDLEPDLPHMNGDQSRIEQLVMNLVVNARDAMPDGGLLQIRTASHGVDGEYAAVLGLDRGLYLRLTVSDTGGGMSEAVALRAFEPFFTTKSQGEGTGLGLATVYGIVTEAGGRVTIRSQLGAGTEVEVLLRSSPEASTVARNASLAKLHTAHGETILLVEDEEMVREPTRRILTRYGYTVLAAANADEALAIAGERPHEITLLLTDVVMPGRSGKALAAQLQHMSPETKVLFMSGYTSDVVGFRAAAEPGVNLIEKPFASADLLRRVRDVIDNG